MSVIPSSDAMAPAAEIEAEGVIKYRLEHTAAPPLPAAELAELQAWHRICRPLELLGQHPDRYLGYAYGNLSRRRADAPGFIISATQTSGQVALAADDYAWVQDWSAAENRVTACGPARPSSEALTHGVLYGLDARIGAVVHAHSAPLWSAARTLGLPGTPADVPYGTPAMAAAVVTLVQALPDPSQGLFVMQGHEDGVVTFGPDLATAGALMVRALAAALAIAGTAPAASTDA